MIDAAQQTPVEAPAVVQELSTPETLGVNFTAEAAKTQDIPETTLTTTDAYADAAVTLLQEPTDAALEAAAPATTLVDAEPTLVEGGPEAVASGVDLSPLLNFTDVRTERSHRDAQIPKQHKGNKKPSRPAAERRPQQQPQPARKPAAALLRNEKSASYLREAMASRPAEGGDGVGHINTSAAAETEWGKILDLNAYAPFNHPDLGAFRSVGGLWYFVGAKVQDDSFRTLCGGAVRVKGARTDMREVPGFKMIIAEATWMKVNANDVLVKTMVANELPYRSYFPVGEFAVPQSTQIASWYVPVLEEIARTLKAIHKDGVKDAVPNFDFLERAEQREAKRNQDRRDNRRDDRRGQRDARPQQPRRDNRAAAQR